MRVVVRQGFDCSFKISKATCSRVRTIIKKYNSRIFQYIPGWVEINFQDISDTVYHTSVAVNMLLNIFFTVFGGGGTFISHLLIKLIS